MEVLKLRQATYSPPTYIDCYIDRVIIASAILSRGKLWTGTRHNDIQKEMEKDSGSDLFKQLGFITNDVIFLGRKTAARIAFEAGQIEKNHDELFSENLWDRDGEPKF